MLIAQVMMHAYGLFSHSTSLHFQTTVWLCISHSHPAAVCRSMYADDMMSYLHIKPHTLKKTQVQAFILCTYTKTKPSTTDCTIIFSI